MAHHVTITDMALSPNTPDTERTYPSEEVNREVIILDKFGPNVRYSSADINKLNENLVIDNVNISNSDLINSENTITCNYNKSKNYQSIKKLREVDKKRWSVGQSSLMRNFRLTSLSSLTGWVTNINDYVSQRRESMLQQWSFVNAPSMNLQQESADIDVSSVVSQRYYISTEKRVLKPYSLILKCLGMRAIGYPDNLCHKFLSISWMFVVFGTIFSGYALNLFLCQHNKLDMESQGSFKNVCTNHSLITYHYVKGMCESTLEGMMPSAIHFIAFAFSFWIFRIAQSEQVEALVQKAFTVVHSCTNSESRRTRFLQRLKVLYFGGYIFLFIVSALTFVNSYYGKSLLLWKCTLPKLSAPKSDINYRHYYMGSLFAIPMCLIYGILVPILLNFIIQSRLICFLLLELRETLREKRNTLKAMMQEAHDISSFLHKMNKEAAPAMSIIIFFLAYELYIDTFSIVDTMYSAHSMTDLFGTRECDNAPDDIDTCRSVKSYGNVSFVVVGLRAIALFGIFFYTLYEGCCIATSFKRLVNQALETRVFGFKENTPIELDSFQVYLSALRMRAKLFQYPMETKRMLLPIILVIFMLLCLDISYSIINSV